MTETIRYMIYLFFLTFISFLYIQCSRAVPTDQNQRGTLVLKLPPVFDDRNCPKDNQKEMKCFDLIGCVRVQIDPGTPHDPKDIGAEFGIYSRRTRNFDNTIKYDPTNHCDEQSNCAQYPYDLRQLKEVDFDPKRRTIVVVAGYMSSGEDGWRVDIRNRWLDLEDVNVIVVSWKDGNHETYPQAVLNTRVIARQITVLMYYLAIVRNVNPWESDYLKKFNLVGHSLGAHICGFVGKDFSGKIGRITGLDPAGPMFVKKHRGSKLDKTDAQLVETLHTNGGIEIPFFGHEDPLGHVDYYANGGSSQPNCIEPKLLALNLIKVACSHGRATKLYVNFLEDELSWKKIGSSRRYISAVRSESFLEYSAGSGLATHCPKLALSAILVDDGDKHLCSIPIDFTSPFDIVKQRLASTHRVSFDPNVKPMERLYFKTGGDNPYLRRHYIVRMRYERSLRLLDSVESKFDLDMTIETHKGTKKDYNITGLSMYDYDNSYNLVTPNMMMEEDSNAAFIELEANNYYLASGAANNKMLQQTVLKIFPRSITIKLKEGGDPVKGLLKIVRSITNKAKLNLQHKLLSLSLQLLGYTGRPITATYAVGNMLDNPEIFLAHIKSQLQPDNPWAHFKPHHFRDWGSITLGLKSIIIGNVNEQPTTSQGNNYPSFNRQDLEMFD